MFQISEDKSMKYCRITVILIFFAAVIGGLLGYFFTEELNLLSNTQIHSADFGAADLLRDYLQSCYKLVKPIIFVLAAGYTVFALPVAAFSSAVFAAFSLSQAAFCMKSDSLSFSEKIIAVLILASAVIGIYIFICLAKYACVYSHSQRNGITDAKTLIVSRSARRYISDSLLLSGILLLIMLIERLLYIFFINGGL